MYNLAISLGVGLVAYLLGLLVAGWLAGFLPAILAAVGAYILLARRTGRQLEAIMKEAGEAFQGGKLDRGRELLHSAFALAPWQFLVKEQLHAQLGAVDYLQRNWAQARTHLEQAWSRNWMSQAMLACLDHREGKHQDALARMEKATGPGSGDPIFWAVYGWLALEAGDRDRAVTALSRGVEKNKASAALQDLAEVVRNKKRIRPEKQFQPFAPGWYQFFPEHMPRSQILAAQAQAQGQAQGKDGGPRQPRPGTYTYPAPKGFRR